MNEGIPPGKIEAAIQESTGIPFEIASQKALGGGCINRSGKLTGTDGRVFFLKYNSASFGPVFAAEASALEAMAETRTIRAPQPVAMTTPGGSAFLIMEYLPLEGRSGDWSRMGRELARMHRSVSHSFGWPEDNWIGSTPQKNTHCADWIEFYAEYRLKPQFRMAAGNGQHFRNAEALIASLAEFFDSYTPRPSLLHGDLWAGNAGFLNEGTPAIFDPASYYGDREADLAMTELFGGFPPSFYSGYASEWPLDPGYRTRKTLYNLYHILNHFNIFGGGYASQADGMIQSLLAVL